MRFKIVPGQMICCGKVVYRAEEYSFDFEAPSCDGGISSILINDVQLEIDEEGRVLWAWGVCPYSIWEQTSSTPPDYIRGSLVALLDKEIIPGVSYRLTEPGAWRVYVNPDQGWVCVGNLVESGSIEAVEFATDTIAVVKDEVLKAIWLHPEKIPDLADR